MNQLTVGQVRNAVAKSLNLCPADSEVLQYINRAEERLMDEGDWLGTWQVYRFCVNENCLVFPRRVERITLLDVNNVAVPVRNQWYEFLENGPGFITNNPTTSIGTSTAFGCCGSNSHYCSGLGLVDRGTTCLFNDIPANTALKIKVYADVAEDPAAIITLRGYDENLNWIQTQPGATWIEGEQVGINVGIPQVSSKRYYSPGPMTVIKPVTNGPIRLYSYDDSVFPPVQWPLAVYEPGETMPIYRRSLIPGLKRTVNVGDTSCQLTTVTALVKLRHIELVSDLDVLVLQSTEAIKLAAQSIRKEDNNLLEEANLYYMGKLDPVTRRYHNGAIPVLQAQLDNYLGGGAVNPMRFEPREIAGAGIMNLI